MSLCIAILEDNAERRVAMEQAIAKHLPQYPVVFFTAADRMNAWLTTNLQTVVAISLDHDLESEVDDSGERRDCGDGREVADFLCSQSVVCRIVIHSTNVPAAQGMEFALQESGWSTERITPYEDLAWVKEAWLPLLLQALAGR